MCWGFLFYTMKNSLSLGLHQTQLNVFNSPARGNVLVAGRGWGKSRLILTDALIKCLSYSGKIDRASPKAVAIGMPFLTQARQVHWGAILDMLEDQPFVDGIDKSNFRVKFKGKNTLDLLIRGADNQASKWRGLSLVAAYLDEYQDFGVEAWEKAIFPALARNSDWSATLVGTPKGTNNILYKAVERCVGSDSWKYWHYTSKDNPFFPRAQLREAKLLLPPKVYDQEFRASFVNFDGQWFPSLSDENIQPVRQDPARYRSTFLGVDWGDRNPALSVVGLTHDGTYHIVSNWEPAEGQIITEKELTQQAVSLCRQWNVWRSFLPDDRPAMVKSFRLAGKELNVPGLAKAVMVNRNEPGITESLLIIDSLFFQKRLYIDSSLKTLAEDFRGYHKEKESTTGLLLNTPARGQRSHGIDSCRYIVATLEYKHFPGSKAPDSLPTRQDFSGLSRLIA
jgi:Terminase large subunit, T4likevirus-type, N-terminal